MNTQRKTGCAVDAPEYRHPLIQAINPVLTCLETLADPSPRAVRWTPKAAALAALLMAISAQQVAGGRLEEALECLHQSHGDRPWPTSHNGLYKALLRQEQTVCPVLKKSLQEQTCAAFARLPKTAGWTLLAVDGSKVELPRTVSNEEHFGIADSGKAPQAFMTVIVEARTQLLWDFRIDKGKASEKGHLIDMVDAFPKGCLLLGDGNFVGHPLWGALKQRGCDFLIRVGGNVSLIQNLFPDAHVQLSQAQHHDQIVYVWPRARQQSEPPLKLRLIKVGTGQAAVYLLTSVLSKKRLSDRMAAKIYRLRWSAELFYRGFKRTYGFFRLTSRSGPRSRIELTWALLACWIMKLIALDAISAKERDPTRLSMAQALQVLRRSLVCPADHRVHQTSLTQRLALCLRDTYKRKHPKASRHRPRTRNTPRNHVLKPPRTRQASAAEQKLAAERYRPQAA